MATVKERMVSFAKAAKGTKFSMILLAVFLLWAKTHLAYHTAFSSMKIDNQMQAFILLINPFSFLLVIFGFALFLKGGGRNLYLFLCDLLLTVFLYANIVFYRFFNDFITLPLLFQSNNFGDLDASILSEMKPADLLYFADLPLWAYIFIKKPAFSLARPFSKLDRRVYCLITAAVIFFNLGLAETERPELLTRTFDREMLVKLIGPYNYALYDIYLQSKTTALRAMADGSELSEIENYVRANKARPSDLFGAAKGKNVILISLESTQSFVIDNRVYGQEITPFLNDFIRESYYFDNFYHQTGQGKTSDAEFLIDNSLYPLGRGAVFFTHAGNEYRALPEILNEKGYFTAALHANNKSFWNRDIMYETLGYQRFYHMDDYEVTEENSVGWGLKDIPFFEQSVGHLKSMPQPFYAKLITLTNHHPFELDESDRLIEPYQSASKTLNQYFLTVRYEDEALKVFIEKLKEEGLYDNSVIIMYGDHYGISPNHNEAMGEYLGKEITPFENAQLQRVPLIIHIPGHKGKVISTVGGQIDLKPTILHLLGIETDDDIGFGQDLFSPERREFAVFRDGSVVTKDYLWAAGTCYDKESGEETEERYCAPFRERGAEELKYSDRIIYGDLLRFYAKDGKD